MLATKQSKMDRQFKVLVLCMADTGHFNPIICYLTELTKNKNIKAIMYGPKRTQAAIEKANIEFREANLGTPADIVNINAVRKRAPLKAAFDYFMDTSDKILPELVRCVKEEDIDLIIYDYLTVYGRWLVKRLNSNQDELKKPPPKAILFMPSLLHEEGIYPNSVEKKLTIQPRIDLLFIFELFLFTIKFLRFCYRHKLPLHNPVDMIYFSKEELNICCIVPEFQPRSHMFPKSCRFVGTCASEEVRSSKEFEEPLKSFLQPFPERNPLPLVNLKLDDSLLDNNSKLIYVSLGTVVNNTVEPFLKLIDGIKVINASTPSNQKFKFLMSTGDLIYDKLQSMAKNNTIEIPDNLLIMRRVPQLDVLKRASLYVTHSGQGGTSESIYYGVPMVCIPVMGDQLAVAYRVSDELGMGIQLNYDTFTAQDLEKAVVTVLNDKSYMERTLLFSQISRKYNGPEEATRLTIEYLQKRDTLKNKSE